ncbi:nuclear transport factor 2 family protein [Amycolatopsis sp. cmx-11-12]|uniref:nuclear transport factor 2 family protein n=1 Tax=Amycolatopsis sp. cmx-11-12 TaxID=2785795 RepID=UPI003918350D
MSTPADQRSFEKIYAEVQQFYAEHVHLMDGGSAEEAAATFTEDASLLSPPKVAEPIRGRANLAAGLRRAAQALADEGVTYRRCYSMISVRQRVDGELHVRSYVQVIATRRGGEANLHAMCVCDDVLVREGGSLKVRDRRVIRDDCL